MTAALLVIDLQVDVLESCWDADGVVTRTARLVERARAAAAPVVQHEEPELRAGTPGWEFAPGLVPADGDPRVFKRHRDAFADTDLAEILTGLGADRLILTGAQSDYCVRTTAQAAAIHGYSLTLVSDAHTTCDTSWDSVAIDAEQIVAHTNRYFAGLTYPGVTVDLGSHERATFD